MPHVRPGFTLVELLVVIAIIGVLIALLLPAVQAARESARRSQCVNHLKQIGLAAQNYHDTLRTFPPAGLNYGAIEGVPVVAYNNIMNTSGFVLMLPFMEQQSLYDKFNKNVAACSSTYTGGSPGTPGPYPIAGAPLTPATSGNDIVVSTQLPVFLCPSDDGTRTMAAGAAYGITSTDTLLGAKTSYEFSTKPGDDINYPNGWQTWYANNGYMQYRALSGMNSNATTTVCQDGTTNTVAFIETPLMVYNGNGNAWGYRGWVMYGVTLYDNRTKFPIQSLCGTQVINCWTYSTTATSYQPGRVASWGMSGSLHPGGCNVVLADGSVRFLSEVTDTNILGWLCDTSDGASVGSF